MSTQTTPPASTSDSSVSSPSATDSSSTTNQPAPRADRN
jgi:hypothetical protein